MERKIAIAAVIVLFATVLSVDARGGKDWVVLQNCQLILNLGNDGDSFHVQVDDTEYLVRLYFDAPETASVGPARLIEQAEYFGVSVPRTVFVMQGASDDTTDNRVVRTCCKNNDGELGGRSAWERRNGLFASVSDIDWDTFDNPHKDKRGTITADDLAAVFHNGQKQLRRDEAEKALEALTGAKRTACYEALKVDGRFAKQLRETDGLLSWKP